jgi:hypothetical protein
VSAGFVQVGDSVYLPTWSGCGFLRQYGYFHWRYAKVQVLNESMSFEYEKWGTPV